MRFSSRAVLFSVFLIFFSFCVDFITTLDAITKSQFLRDSETVSSNNSVFKLGFFSPGNSVNRYLGIWYLSESDVIWVANREQPLTDSSGIVTISEDGNLVVMNGKKQAVWSSNGSSLASNSRAKLLDTGNLVLQDHSTGNTFWESFQHPTHSLVPRMKLSTNKVTGKKFQITSWKNPSDPSTGNFFLSIERLSIPELFIFNKTKAHWRTGPWNGRVFLGVPTMKPSYLFGVIVGKEEDGTVHESFSLPDGTSDFIISVLDSQGTVHTKYWRNKKETGHSISPANDSDIYGFCGSFGTCNAKSSPICSCLKGFTPNNTGEWSQQNWKSGCVRRVPLQCERIRKGGEAGKDDGFLKLETTKVPDFAERSAVSEDTCRTQCLQNCSCIAYAYDAGIGCMSWSGNLIDIQRFTEGGADLYIKVAHSELDKKRDKAVIITVAVIVGTIIVAASAYFLWAWTKKHSGDTHSEIQKLIGNEEEVKLNEVQLVDYEEIATATNNFHPNNILGRGGFGIVYKGVLKHGQEIAVKRLSNAFGQGIKEFMNEVEVISKLQHRNLVRLLGCYVKGEEKMLIYEFLPNKSLDKILFEPQQQKLLHWRKRFNIIEGIIRGLIYLHKDSRLKIIHRDLKPSNILLDEEMNPKISDFGLARIFKDCEEEANTRRIVGTYGYMSPEYAIKGHYSEKSDVYSFGVLLLEIVSGRKNSSFYSNENSLNLIEFAWNLWNENNIKPFIDPNISDTGFENQILRCIHVGLLCVQELATERPSMATVLSMLNSEIVNLPPAMQVAFVGRRTSLTLKSSLEVEVEGQNSANNVSLTDMRGR